MWIEHTLFRWCHLHRVPSQRVTTHDIRYKNGLDILQISDWYPWYPSIGFGRNRLFSTNYRVSYSLTTVFWYLANIQVGIADIFFNSAEICQIFNWNLVNFLLISVKYTSDIQLISWYAIQRFPGSRYPLWQGSDTKACPPSSFSENRVVHSHFRGAQSNYDVTGNVFPVFLYPLIDFNWNNPKIKKYFFL